VPAIREEVISILNHGIQDYAVSMNVSLLQVPDQNALYYIGFLCWSINYLEVVYVPVGLDINGNVLVSNGTDIYTWTKELFNNAINCAGQAGAFQ
jgi:hypothetical protein